MFEYDLIDRARAERRRLVLPEGTEERILRATEILLRRGVADLTLLGDPDEIARRARELGVDIGARADWSTRTTSAVAGRVRRRSTRSCAATRAITLDLAHDVVTRRRTTSAP